MADIERAKRVYSTLCGYLDGDNWKYDKDDERLIIYCEATGEDLPMEIRIFVDSDRQIIRLFSRLPFVVPEDARLDVAVAVGFSNSNLADGSFDFDINKGDLYFRMTSSFVDSEIGQELFGYMVLCSFRTIDDFNDKFLALAKGMINIEKFLSLVGLEA